MLKKKWLQIIWAERIFRSRRFLHGSGSYSCSLKMALIFLFLLTLPPRKGVSDTPLTETIIASKHIDIFISYFFTFPEF